MAFYGSYGFGSDVSDFFKSAERKFRKEFGRIEQDLRPIIKQVALPVAGAIIGTALLPGIGTSLGLGTMSTATAATIGGGLMATGQTMYESKEAAKEMAAQEAATQAKLQETVATTEALKELQASEQQQTAQAGFFSKPSNLAIAALAIGLIAYVPPLKKGGRGRGRRRGLKRR